MLTANGRITATVLAGLAVVLVCLGRARAEGPDLLKDEAARRKVAAEADERDVRQAADEAYQTARTQPREAVKRIQDLLKLVAANPNFSDDRRDALTMLLKRDLAEIQKIADAAANPDVGSAFHPVPHDPRADDHKKLIDDALAHINSSKEALAESEDLRRRKGEAIAGLMKQVDESSIPPTGDFTFPPNWRELSMRRSKNNNLSDTEKAILKALSATVSVDLTDQRFGAVVDWFQHQTGQTIVLDKPALDDIGVTSESTVSLHLNKVTTRTALKKALADLGLTYVIKDETILVTTPARAKSMMTVRTYYVGDLVGAYDMQFGAYLSQYQALATVAQLVQTIQSNVDPESWQVNGRDDGGTVVFDPVHMTLIVKQSAEVHLKMMEGFNSP